MKSRPGLVLKCRLVSVCLQGQPEGSETGFGSGSRFRGEGPPLSRTCPPVNRLKRQEGTPVTACGRSHGG